VGGFEPGRHTLTDPRSSAVFELRTCRRARGVCVRSHRIVAVAAAVGAVVVLSWSATPRAQGRGRVNEAASQPTPKLADGTVNLGRVPGEKGYWNTPYITNMGARVIDPSTGKPFPLVEPAGARGGRGRGDV